MNRPSTETRRYTTVAIAFHWTIAILLVGIVFYAWWMEEVREAAFAGEVSVERAAAVYNWHKTIGLTILVLSLGRLAWRLGHKPPPLPGAMPDWERVAAHVTHVAFYAIMIGAPIAGYVAASSFGNAFPILAFNAVELPKLPVPRTEGFQELAGSVHGAVGWVILVLLAVHVGAALKHHFVNRDGVLTRMVPGVDAPEQTNRP